MMGNISWGCSYPTRSMEMKALKNFCKVDKALKSENYILISLVVVIIRTNELVNWKATFWSALATDSIQWIITIQLHEGEPVVTHEGPGQWFIVTCSEGRA